MSENPYQTPETIATTENAIVSMSFGPVRSLSFLARFAQVLLGIYIVFSVVYVAHILTPAGVEAKSLDQWIELVVRYHEVILYSFLVSTVLYIITAMVVSLWTTKAMLNTWAFSEEKPKITPGWAALWYFIPVFNLWKPYQVMTQIWDGTFHKAKSKWLIRVWWMTWLSSFFCSFLSKRVLYKLGDSEYQGDTGILRDFMLDYTVATSCLAIVAAASLIYVIHKISKAHQTKVTEL